MAGQTIYAISDRAKAKADRKYIFAFSAYFRGLGSYCAKK